MTEFDLLSPNQKAWIVECWSCFPEFHHYAAAECADGLPDELFELEAQADDDKNFEKNFEYWDYFIVENQIWVLLEQSCDEGVMLTQELVYERLKDCPREWLAPMETLLKQCPMHVLAFLAQRHYLAVRMERAVRLRNPIWQPRNGPFFLDEWDKTTWKQASFVARKYSR